MFRQGSILSSCSDLRDPVLAHTLLLNCPKHPEIQSETGRLKLDEGEKTRVKMQLTIASTLISFNKAGARQLVFWIQNKTWMKLVTSASDCFFSRKEGTAKVSSKSDHGPQDAFDEEPCLHSIYLEGKWDEEYLQRLAGRGESLSGNDCLPAWLQ